MTENLIQSDIGINFKASGLDQLKTIMNEMAKYQQSMRDMYQDMRNVNTFSNEFSRNLQSSFNKSFQSIKSNVTGVTDLDKTMKQAQFTAKQLNDTNFNNMNHSVKTTNRSLNETSKVVKNVQESVKNIKPSGMQKLGETTNHTNDKLKDTDKTMSRFKSTALGVFAGNMITNGLNSLGHGLYDATKQGLQLDAAIGDIQKRWNQAGLSSTQSKAMTDQIAQIRQHADISAQAITNMQKQYLTLTGSASQARDLVSTITSFGKASGMTEQQQSSITRLISSNKNINARMFQRVFGQSPEFANEIAKQTGMSKSAFNELVRSGKLTGQQLRDAMIKASKDSSKAWSDYADTATGKMDLIKATINTTKVNFEKGLAGSMLQELNKAAKNSGGLDSLQKKVEKVASEVGKTIGSVIGGVVGFLAKNITPIEKMGNAIWNIVKGLASGVWTTITAPLKLIAGNSKQGSKGLNNIANALTAIGKHQTMLKTIGGLIVGIFAFTQFAKSIIFIEKFVKAFKALKLVTVAVKTAQIAWAAVTKTVTIAQWALNAALSANPIGLLVITIGALVAGLYEAYKRIKPFHNAVNGLFKTIGKVLKGFANTIKKYFGNVIKDQMNNAKNVFRVIGDVIRVFKDIFTLNFKDLGKVIPKLGKDLWKAVKGIWQTGADFIEDIGSNMWKSIWGTFKSWGKNIGNFFVDLWQGIKNKVSDGINGVTGIINTGIKGLNWVLSKVGGSDHTIGLIPKVHFAKGTMGGRLTRNTMAMLNDGNDSPETGNKEMAILPNGKAFIPQKRNWTGLLPKGTAILNATETKMLMMMKGITKFAGGTGFFGKLWNGAKKIGSAIAHPIKYIESLFGGLPKMPEYMADLTGGIANKAKDSLVDWFKRFGNTSANNPAGSNLDRWIPVIRKAAAFMNQSLSGSDLKLILNRIARESGGNPTITQKISDINSRNGHPAQGLLQYVPSTFASWAVKGYGNLLNGYDQIIAMLNDTNWRRDIANNGGWGPTGRRARRNGGDVRAGETYTVNEAGFEMFRPNKDGKVINHEDSKRILGNQSKPIKIDARMTVNINGSADDSVIDKINESHQSQWRQIAETLKSESGIDDGGMIIL